MGPGCPLVPPVSLLVERGRGGRLIPALAQSRKTSPLRGPVAWSACVFFPHSAPPPRGVCGGERHRVGRGVASRVKYPRAASGEFSDRRGEANRPPRPATRRERKGVRERAVIRNHRTETSALGGRLPCGGYPNHGLSPARAAGSSPQKVRRETTVAIGAAVQS